MRSSWHSVFLVVCEFSVNDGPMLHIKALQDFRIETKGLSFLIRADRLIRKEVAKLMSDERISHPTFQGTLVSVLNNCKHLWIKAQAEAKMALLNQGSPGARKQAFFSFRRARAR